MSEVTNGLSEMDKIELKNRTKGLSDEELSEVIKLIPSDTLWEELIRRNTSMLQKINNIEEVLGITVDNISTISIIAWEDIRKRYFDLENKFKAITKGFRI